MPTYQEVLDKYNSLSPKDQQASLGRLSTVDPKLRDRLIEDTQQSSGGGGNWFTKGLGAVGDVFETVGEVSGAVLSSPWTHDKETDTSGMNWLEKERAQFREADMPSLKLGFEYPKFLGGGEASIGVKGALKESLFMLPAATPFRGASIIARTAGLARGAAGFEKIAKGASALERGLAYPITKPLGMAGGAVGKAVGLGAKPVNKTIPYYRPLMERMEFDNPITHSRKSQEFIASRGVLPKRIVEAIGGQQATVGLDESGMRTLKSALVSAYEDAEILANNATGWSGTKFDKAFRLNDDMSLNLKTVDGFDTNPGIVDVIRNPSQFDLTAAQRDFIETAWAQVDEVQDVMRSYGIPVPEQTAKGLMLSKGWEHYFPRTTMTRRAAIDNATGKVRPLKENEKLLPGETLIPEKDIINYPQMNKQEVYASQKEGIEAGRKYLHPMDQLNMYIQRSLIQVADSQASAILTPHKFIPKLEALSGRLEGMVGRATAADSGIINISQKEIDNIRKFAPDIATQLERRTEEAIDDALSMIDSQLEILGNIPRDYTGTTAKILTSINEPGTVRAMSRTAHEVVKLKRDIRKLRSGKLKLTQNDVGQLFKASAPTLNHLFKSIDNAFKDLRVATSAAPSEVKARLKAIIDARPETNSEYLQFLKPTQQREAFEKFKLGKGTQPDWPMYQDFDVWKKAHADSVIDLTTKEINLEGVSKNVVDYGYPKGRLTVPKDVVRPSELAEALRLSVNDIDELHRITEIITKDAYRGGTKAQRDTFAKLLVEKRSATKLEIAAAEKELGLAKGRKQAFSAAYRSSLSRESREMSLDAHINNGRFKGYFFPRQVAKEMNDFYGEKANVWAKKVQSLAAAPRTLTTGFDAGVGFIHLLPLITKNPKAWAQAMRYQYVGIFKDPDAYIRHVTSPENKRFADELSTWGLDIVNPTSEMVESLGKGGIVHRAASKVPGGRNVVTRFEKGFNGALGVGQLELYKSLRRIALTPEGVIDPTKMRELVNFIGKSTGVISSRRMGVGATQRAAESGFAFFAPRYFRAGMALWTDMLKGGIEGSQARKTLAQLVGGATALYAGTATALGQPINLDPTKSDFMVLKIGDSNVGIGSFHIAMIKAIATTMGAPGNDNKSLMALNSKDNPLVKFVRGKASIPTSVAWDIFTGRTYLGEPLDSGNDVFREEILGRSTPFWASNFITEDPAPSLSSLPFSTHGFRTWAIQWGQKRDTLRDKYSQEDYNGRKYDELDKDEKAYVNEAHEDLVNAIDKADKQYRERATGDNVILNNYKDMRRFVKDYRADRLTKAEEAVKSGVMSLPQFREFSGEVGNEVSGMYSMMEEDPQFDKVDGIFEKLRKDPDPEKVFDVAYDQYVELAFNSDFEDEYGMFEFSKYNDAIDGFIDLWGLDVYDRVQQFLHYDDKLPDLALELKRVREVLEPYWEISGNVLNALTPIHRKQLAAYNKKRTEMANRGDPDWGKRELVRDRGLAYIVKRAESEITNQRRRMRDTNKQINDLLSMWYQQFSNLTS